MNDTKKLFLIDAFPLIYQSFYAYKKSHLFTSKGLNTSPIIHFTNFLINLLIRENPTYMSVVFDKHQETFRKKTYKKYKSHRRKIPKEIQIAIPYIEKILTAFRILFIHSYNGYEADDVIGTIAKKAENKGYIVYIISLDKDFFQLITKNIKIYIPPFKGNPKKIMGIEDIQRKFEIHYPKQIIDLWSMMGDSSDNIPGIPGIGEKNAKKFLKKYGNIENFLNSTYDLQGKMKENVEKNKQFGYLSKQLITIVTNIPFNFQDQMFFVQSPNWIGIQKIFDELEFVQLLKKTYQYYKKHE
ncbi:5'-3' exonuclease [Blattabacterium cuenoti]|uniref:5'-3' exonuclease n=1 Tax=Blattabacterium cuenoti TaxID=1653831 RepID=UPI00163C640A|nr:5'-3' exonuclease H3TH domain-containing protein [Blattabacterium cuenoti]